MHIYKKLDRDAIKLLPEGKLTLIIAYGISKSQFSDQQSLWRSHMVA